MTATWSYNGMKDQSKFSLDAVIRRMELRGEKILSITPTKTVNGEVVEAIIIYEDKK